MTYPDEPPEQVTATVTEDFGEGLCGRCASWLKESLARIAGQLAGLPDLLARIEATQKEIIMSQSDIDAATTQLTSDATVMQAVAADLGAAVTNITAEIAALQANGVNTAALDAAVAPLAAIQQSLQAADASVDALETPPPAPPAG
jgi:peptidyl-tRNA hydrolase